MKPDGLFLILELMHFAHEVIEPDTLKSAAGMEIGEKELVMAKQLIGALAGLEPGEYEDEYEGALKKVIEAKIENRPAESKAPTPSKWPATSSPPCSRAFRRRRPRHERSHPPRTADRLR